ncbi:hypothetical protein Q8A73_020686 [Channa argus]|nr:hypothetical protein Q8A73_020686 [Channa argus]
MAGFRYSLVVSVLWLWTPAGGEADVSCVFMESCILPCSFQSGTDVVIHWIQTAANLPVHSYYYNQDQFVHQDQYFRGRTSLFKEQLSRGNASLQLTRIEVQDQGKYKCYVSTNRGSTESIMKLKVDAPVSKIHIEQVGNRITCSSEGIYPEPEITWSTNPPSTFNNTTRVQQTEQQLYNISSSLILSDHVPDVDHSCSISTRRNTRRATLLKPASVNGSSSEISVPCFASNTSPTDFPLIWRFNHSQIILNRTSTNHTVSEEWRPHVRSVSESGSLTLQHVSSKQEGRYTCELSNKEETFINDIFLRIEKGQGNSIGVGGTVVMVMSIVGAAAAAAVYSLVQYKKSTSQNSHTQSSRTQR